MRIDESEVARKLEECLSAPLDAGSFQELIEELSWQGEQLRSLHDLDFGALQPAPGWVPTPVDLPSLVPSAPHVSAGGSGLPEQMSLGELSEAIARGRVSPLEVTEACLRRIETLDGDLNSFLTVTGDRAVEEARERTEELSRGARRGPLHGIPIGLKDLFQTAGVRTTAGSRILADWIPDTDATVVRRLREAGAVSLGKLHMHEFAFGATGDNQHYGRSVHPDDPARLTGGSSSGSAAAVAAHLCYGALGSDTGGSIRCPAGLCGIVGLKPTYGRVSRAGVVPLAWSLDHVGPMTRTVADAGLMLQAIAGDDPADSATSRLPVPDYLATLEGGVRGLRLGVPREYLWSVIQPGVELRVREAIELLRQEGAEIREISLETTDLASAAQSAILCAEATAFHRRNLRTRSEDYGRSILQRLLSGLFIDSSDYLAAQRARLRVQGELLARLHDVDAILTPTVPVVAPKPGEWIQAGEVVATARYYMVRNTYLFNNTGLPAISVPCGRSEGLPVGLQIAGRPWEEALILRIARAYERA